MGGNLYGFVRNKTISHVDYRGLVEFEPELFLDDWGFAFDLGMDLGVSSRAKSPRSSRVKITDPLR